jgi:preprotein translocase subunit SecE
VSFSDYTSPFNPLFFFQSFSATIQSQVKAIINFFGEVKLELSKVTWPSRNEVIKLTLTVFLVSGIIGAYVGGLDYLFTTVLAKVVTK